MVGDWSEALKIVVIVSRSYCSSCNHLVTKVVAQRATTVCDHLSTVPF